MAEAKHHTGNAEERIYNVPLRRECMKVPRYKRARKGVVALKEFIARHMKVPNHDVSKVKVDTYLNNEMWFRGSSNSPSHVKVKAVRNGELVHVGFVEIPQIVKFAQAKHERLHKKSAGKKDTKKDENIEDKKEEAKTEEQKKDESEKGKSVALANEKLAEQQAKAQKHTAKSKAPEIHRMALKK